MGYDYLIRSRKDCRACASTQSSALCNGSVFEFDPAVVSHWSQWLGHQRPKLLVVGQDFSDVEYFSKNQGLDDATSPTNTRLRLLLGEAGILVGPPPFRDETAPVYLTNSILCLKAGGMAGPIRDAWVRNCARLQLAPLVAHLQPPAVVAMGGHALNAVRQVFAGCDLPIGIKAAAGRYWVAPSGTRVFAVGPAAGLGWSAGPGSNSCPTGARSGGHSTCFRPRLPTRARQPRPLLQRHRSGRRRTAKLRPPWPPRLAVDRVPRAARSARREWRTTRPPAAAGADASL